MSGENGVQIRNRSRGPAVTLAAALAAPVDAGGVGQTALNKCVDAVVAACNKKSDSAANPCVDNGFSQCEKQHKASIRLPKPTRSQATGLATPGR